MQAFIKLHKKYNIEIGCNWIKDEEIYQVCQFIGKKMKVAETEMKESATSDSPSQGTSTGIKSTKYAT